ncbi:hypothetical protein ACO22_04644, partial [Paracoccidioides brasiliensis]
MVYPIHIAASAGLSFLPDCRSGLERARAFTVRPRRADGDNGDGGGDIEGEVTVMPKNRGSDQRVEVTEMMEKIERCEEGQVDLRDRLDVITKANFDSTHVQENKLSHDERLL